MPDSAKGGKQQRQDIFGAIGKVVGSLIDANSAKKAGKRNEELQRDFAQHGIRWKVEDARAAGIHPLFALGASTSMPSPTYVGSNVGSALADAGADIGRSINATRTAEERREAEASAFMLNQVQASDARVLSAEQLETRRRSDALDLENKALHNTLLASQIMRLGSARTPPLPSTGDALVGGGARPLADLIGPGLTASRGSVSPSGSVKVKPADVVSSDPGDPGRAAGSTPGLQRYRYGGESGASIDLPGQQLSESLEGLGIFGHIAGPAILGGNYILKKLYGYDKPPDKLLPSGYRWEWSAFRQSWSPVRKGN